MQSDQGMICLKSRWWSQEVPWLQTMWLPGAWIRQWKSIFIEAVRAYTREEYWMECCGRCANQKMLALWDQRPCRWLAVGITSWLQTIVAEYGTELVGTRTIECCLVNKPTVHYWWNSAAKFFQWVNQVSL